MAGGGRSRINLHRRSKRERSMRNQRVRRVYRSVHKPCPLIPNGLRASPWPRDVYSSQVDRKNNVIPVPTRSFPSAAALFRPNFETANNPPSQPAQYQQPNQIFQPKIDREIPQIDQLSTAIRPHFDPTQPLARGLLTLKLPPQSHGTAFLQHAHPTGAAL